MKPKTKTEKNIFDINDDDNLFASVLTKSSAEEAACEN